MDSFILCHLPISLFYTEKKLVCECVCISATISTMFNYQWDLYSYRQPEQQLILYSKAKLQCQVTMPTYTLCFITDEHIMSHSSFGILGPSYHKITISLMLSPEWYNPPGQTERFICW